MSGNEQIDGQPRYDIKIQIESASDATEGQDTEGQDTVRNCVSWFYYNGKLCFGAGVASYSLILFNTLSAQDAGMYTGVTAVLDYIIGFTSLGPNDSNRPMTCTQGAIKALDKTLSANAFRLITLPFLRCAINVSERCKKNPEIGVAAESEQTQRGSSDAEGPYSAI